MALTDGRSFGMGDRDCVRINFATSQPILREVVGRMEAALGR